MAKRERSETDDLLDRLRGSLMIDKHELDTELQEQPDKFFDAAEAYVKAAARRDYLKDEIKRVDAGLYTYHRKKQEKLGKATEGSVNSAVLQDATHQEAVAAHLAASEKADLYLALKESFHQRSYMIRDLCALFIAKYYETNSVSGDTGVTREMKSQKNMDKLAEARKRKRERG
jgi:hypothetical protein